MCCGAPKYNARRNQAATSSPTAPRVGSNPNAPTKPKVPIGRKITQSRMAMGPQKPLPKYEIPATKFK